MSTDMQNIPLKVADAAFKAEWDRYFDALEASYPEQVWDVERTQEARQLAMIAWRQAYDQAIEVTP